MLEEMCELKFENDNFKRQLLVKNDLIDSLRMQTDTHDANLRYLKEKQREIDTEKEILKAENTNLRIMVKALEEKNEILI